MEFTLSRTTEILQRTPKTLAVMLPDLSVEWTRSNYGVDTFSPFDVVGHLLHGEKTDWMPRLRIILEHGESKPFEPFDRYAMFQFQEGRSLGELLAEFEGQRTANLRELDSLNLTTDQLELIGTHPDFGPVSVRQLIATWAVHDLNHIHQIAKSMAYQYRDEIGPFRAYLGVLKGM